MTYLCVCLFQPDPVIAIVFSFLRCGEARRFCGNSRRLRSILCEYGMLKYDLCPFWSYIYFQNLCRKSSRVPFSAPFLYFTSAMNHWNSNEPSPLVYSVNLTGYLDHCNTRELHRLSSCPVITIKKNKYIDY